MIYLKQAVKSEKNTSTDVRDLVQGMLDKIAKGGEAQASAFAREFDKWDGPALVSADDLAAATDKVPAQLRKDIQFAHGNVKRFAEAQLTTIQDTQLEIIPGLIAGQKQIPMNSAGCYVPGGRYSHIASAMMTITTAKVAGVKHIAACSPPRPGEGIPPAILYAMHLSGADAVLSMGGVQAVASMAMGLFDLPKADILVGPGNQFVAEAKRILYGQVGIDMFAGPTNLLDFGR